MDISIVLVTSPFPSQPNTSIINYVIRSFDLIEGLENCPIKIIFDGYKLADEDRFKKGRITEQSKQLYDQYYENLKEDWKDSPNVELIRSPDHIGFAYCVKMGLELCTSKYALIAQHDRCFTIPFPYLHLLLEGMEKFEYIRYIGFPTSKNITHDRVISCTYRLTCLNFNPQMKHQLLEQYLYLQPLIFWFDSQHLCHRERYLQIFYPYKSFPSHLRDIFGLKAVKDMFLKPGDFIEDKFGQQQRNFFIYLKENGYDDSLIIELFKWFGSYLCWIDPEVSFEEASQTELSAPTTFIMVRHLNGRVFDFDKMREYIKNVGVNRIKNKSYLEIFKFDLLEENNLLEAADDCFSADQTKHAQGKSKKDKNEQETEDVDIGGMLFDDNVTGCEEEEKHYSMKETNSLDELK